MRWSSAPCTTPATRWARAASASSAPAPASAGLRPMPEGYYTAWLMQRRDEIRAERARYHGPSVLTTALLSLHAPEPAGPSSASGTGASAPPAEDPPEAPPQPPEPAP